MVPTKFKYRITDVISWKVYTILDYVFCYYFYVNAAYKRDSFAVYLFIVVVFMVGITMLSYGLPFLINGKPLCIIVLYFCAKNNPVSNSLPIRTDDLD
jgi:hypothetical protein